MSYILHITIACLQEYHAQLMESTAFHYQLVKAMLRLDVTMELMENAFLRYPLELLSERKPAD